MFVLPSVFPGPVVTKGHFPSVTAELSQARVPLAPVREAWGTLQGLATCREGALPPGCQAAASAPLFGSALSGDLWAFLLALSPGTGPKHSRTRILR